MSHLVSSPESCHGIIVCILSALAIPIPFSDETLYSSAQRLVSYYCVHLRWQRRHPQVLRKRRLVYKLVR